MKPTAEYIAWSSTEKYRHVSECGLLHAALEHEGVGTVPSVYLSQDGGKTFGKLEWKLSWFSRLKQLFHALDWPPAEDIAELRVDPDEVVIRCAQSSETDILWREFFYDIKRGVWRAGHAAASGGRARA